MIGNYHSIHFYAKITIYGRRNKMANARDQARRAETWETDVNLELGYSGSARCSGSTRHDRITKIGYALTHRGSHGQLTAYFVLELVENEEETHALAN